MRVEESYVTHQHTTAPVRELSKGLHDRIGPQFFSSLVLTSGVAGYRLELGIYRRAHSFLLAEHFIRTGSWALASLRLTSPRRASPPRPWAISYKCVVNYLPRGRDTAVLLHRCSSPSTLASLLLYRRVTSTDCLPTAPSLLPSFSHLLSPLFPPSLSCSHVIPRSRFFSPRAVSSSASPSLSSSSSSGTLWRRVLRKLMFI